MAAIERAFHLAIVIKLFVPAPVSRVAVFLAAAVLFALKIARIRCHILAVWVFAWPFLAFL